MQDREQQWSELYQKLQGLFEPKGTESYVGKEDYWIVDDDWGGTQQKVYIWNLEFIGWEELKEIQSLLRGPYEKWSVMVEWDVDPVKEGEEVRGMIVYSNKIENHINLNAAPRELLARLGLSRE